MSRVLRASLRIQITCKSIKVRNLSINFFAANRKRGKKEKRIGKDRLPHLLFIQGNLNDCAATRRIRNKGACKSTWGEIFGHPSCFEDRGGATVAEMKRKHREH